MNPQYDSSAERKIPHPSQDPFEKCHLYEKGELLEHPLPDLSNELTSKPIDLKDIWREIASHIKD